MAGDDLRGPMPAWMKWGLIAVIVIGVAIAVFGCGEVPRADLPERDTATSEETASDDADAADETPVSEVGGAPADSAAGDTLYSEPGFGTDVLEQPPPRVVTRAFLRALAAPPADSGVDTTVTSDGDSVAVPWRRVVRLGVPDTFYKAPAGGGTVLHAMRLGAYNCPLGVAPGPYGACAVGVKPGTVAAIIAAHRAAGTRIMLLLNGGHHRRYRVREPESRWRDKGYLQRFSTRNWKDSLARYDSPAIRAAIDSGVADGTVIGHAVMDEPGNVSVKTGNYWAYPGFMTRETVNELCRESKRLFPTMPAGPVQDPRHFTAGQYTTDCDFSHAQYRLTKDRDLDAYIAAVKAALPQHMGIIWSTNTVHGGEPSTTCPKFGDDPSGKLCPVTPAQLKNWSVRFARDPRACGMVNTWRWEPGLTDRAEYLKAARETAAVLREIPARPCAGGAP